MTPETRDQNGVWKKEKPEKRKTIAVIRLHSDELEKFWQGLGDSIWILDLTEAQDRDESKRQMMLTRVHLQMEA